MMQKLTARSTLGICVLLFAVTASAGQTPKNIILLIGDGMGTGHVTLARLAAQAEGKFLAMDSMRIGGMIHTRAANVLVTDSAAAGTALATGWKTNNGMISILPDDTEVETIAEAAQSLRKSAGIVTTSAVTDATPAVFAAHVDARAQQPEIARQMLAHNLNVMFGGGRANFIPQSQQGSKRKDEIDLLAQARQAGYTVIGSREQLIQLTSPGKVIGLFEMGELTTEAPEPTIAELTEKAMAILSQNRNGFFLMVEGGLIDKRAHSNDAAGVVKQAREFDAAVGVALAFAARQKDTLVVVTADHETGGLAVMPPSAGSPQPWTAAWISKNHSANDVPLLAEGPGAADFGGEHDNTDVAKIMARLWKVSDFPKKIQAERAPAPSALAFPAETRLLCLFCQPRVSAALR